MILLRYRWLHDVDLFWCYHYTKPVNHSMSEEQFKAFLEKVASTPGLQKKLKATIDSDAVIAIAKEEGFNIMAEDLSRFKAEVVDAELKDAAGGIVWFDDSTREFLVLE